MDTGPINSEHAYSMQANRIGPARCPGAEDTRLWSAQISTRMHSQYLAVGLVQPAQDDDLVASRNSVQACLNVGVQYQVRVGCAFIALPWRVGGRGEGTFHASYRAEREVGRGRVGHGGLP